MTRYTAKELTGMSLKSLADVGLALGLTFSKNQTRATRSRKILAAYNTADTSASEDAAERESARTCQHTGDSVEPILHEQKPAFEKLCREPADEEHAVDGETQSTRGGARAGSGRPLGMTNELALYNSLPQQPHPAIRDMFELLFRSWATRSGCAEIALTKDQAFELALPWTQAAHLLGITDVVPAWLMVVLACVWSTANLISAKAAIARAAADNRKANETEAETV